jgi:hypothetical protein
LWAEVDYADDAERWAEARAEFGGQIGCGVEVELDAGERAGVDDGLDFFKPSIDEDADLLEGWRQVGDDGGNLSGRDTARAGRKDKARRVGAELSSELRVL